MKKLILIAAALISTVPAASAVMPRRPGAERPIEHADLIVTEATGHYRNVRDVSLLRTTKGFTLFLDGAATKMKVTGRMPTRCGGTVYTMMRWSDLAALSMDEVHVRLVDDTRSTRCRFIRAPEWQMSLEHVDHGRQDAPGVVVGTIQGHGEPHLVYTIQ